MGFGGVSWWWILGASTDRFLGLIWRGTAQEKSDVLQEPDSGHEGRVREHLAAHPAVPVPPVCRERVAGRCRGAVAGHGSELLVAAAPRAPAGGAGEDRGVGELVARPQGRRVMRRRLPDLEGHHEGGRARPRGVRETHVPHLAQAGLRSRSSSSVMQMIIAAATVVFVRFVPSS